MEKSVFVSGNHHGSFSSSGSQRHVHCKEKGNKFQQLILSCGTCGYELNLSSCNRNISAIGSKYGKSMKRGIISFLDIDESRFNQVDELQCIPHFSKRSWGIFRHRTKLLCRKCGNPIGIAYDDKVSADPHAKNGLDTLSVHGASGCRKYDVRIRALQPSSGEESGIPFFS